MLDTGAPVSFGKSSEVTIAGQRFSVGQSFPGLTVDTLVSHIGLPCAGLLGTDVLGGFDHLFDVTAGTVTLSTNELSHAGNAIALDEYLGIPIVTARIGTRDIRMFFDTGAWCSYLQDASLAEFPSMGQVEDFYPGLGTFRTETYRVPMSIGGVAIVARCGTLPELLGIQLQLANAQGILGNELLRERVVAYFPRRPVLIL